MPERIDIPSVKKVLITRTDKLGDVILTLPLVSEAKKIFNAKIYFLVSRYTRDILRGYEDIDELVFKEDMLSPGEKFSYFRKEKFDLIINAYPRQDIAFASFLAGIKYRIGTAYRWYSFMYNLKVREHRKDCLKHESDYNLNLLANFAEGVGYEKNFKFRYSSAEQNQLKEKLQKFGFDLDSKYIIIHPGTGGSAKDVPLTTFASYINRLTKSLKDYRIALTGTEEEKNVISALKKKITDVTRIADLGGKVNLRELMILIDKSELFISNSTGPIHIAGALNKKIIGFYPHIIPINDTRWKPLGSNSVIINGDIINNELSIDLDKAVTAALESLNI